MKVLLTALSLFSIIGLTAQTDWALKKQEDGIAVFTQESTDSPLDAFKGVTEVRASIPEIIQLLRSVDQMVHWVPGCKVAELKETHGNEQIHYVAHEAPWPASDRDSYVKYTYDLNNPRHVTVDFMALPDYQPPRKKMVRIPRMSGYWLLRYISDSRTEITYQVKADAGGAIPKWLANTAAVDTPYKTLRELRLYLER